MIWQSVALLGFIDCISVKDRSLQPHQAVHYKLHKCRFKFSRFKFSESMNSHHYNRTLISIKEFAQKNGTI